MAHLFICPNCGHRSTATERTAGFRNTPKGCSQVRLRLPVRAARRLLPGAQRRVLRLRPGGPHHRLRPRLVRADRPVRREGHRPRRSARCSGLEFDDGDDHVGTVLEWGVRQLGKPRRGPRRGRPPGQGDRRPLPRVRRRRRAAARADPVEVGCSPALPAMTDRRRNLFVLLLVLGLIAGSRRRRSPTKPTEARPRPPGRRRARLPGQADQAARQVNAEALERALDIMRERVDASASPSRRSRARATTRSTSACRTSRTPSAPPTRSARPPSCSSTTGRRTSSTRTASTNADRGHRRPGSPSPASTTRSSAPSKCDIKRAGEQPGRRGVALLRVRQGPKKPFNNGIPDESREAALDGLSDAAAREGRGHRGQARACSSLRDDEARRPTRPPPTRCCVIRDDPAPVRHRHQEPGAELRPAAAATSRSSPSSSPTRAARVPADHARDRPARRRQRQPAEPRSRLDARSTSRSCSTTSSSRSRTSTSARTRTASTARPARRSPAASRSRAPRTSRTCSRPARCRSGSS